MLSERFYGKGAEKFFDLCILPADFKEQAGQNKPLKLIHSNGIWTSEIEYADFGNVNHTWTLSVSRTGLNLQFGIRSPVPAQ